MIANNHENNVKLDKVDASLYHLVFIGNTIENLFRSFNNIIGKVEDKDETIIYSGIYSMILINTVSFLDEFNNHFISEDPEMREIINSIKKAVKPAIAGLNNWKELNDFRNNVLAHNLRRNGNVSVFETGIGSYDIPKGGADLHIIFSCIQMVNDVLKSAFREKLEKIQLQIDKVKPTIEKNQFSSTQEVENEVEKIRNQINLGIAELKRKHGFL